MAQNVTVAGVSYSDVPSIEVPKATSGMAVFTDTSPTTAVESDVTSGKIFFRSDGSQAVGTGSGGGTTWETVYNGTVSCSDPSGTGYYNAYINPWDGGTIDLNSVWRVTWDSVQYECIATWYNTDGDPYALGNYTYDGGSGGTEYPFMFQVYWGETGVVIGSSGNHTFKLEKQVSSGSTLVPKNITANGTYDPADDDADGYSEVTVAIPSGTEGTPTATKGSVNNHSISVTPSVTNSAGVISGGTHTGTAVTVSASELVSGSETKTANGTYDVTNLAQLVIAVSGGGGLEYESGTYTPTSDTAQPTISFSNSHTKPPAFVAISDASAASGISSNSNTSWAIVDHYRIAGTGWPYSTSATRTGIAFWTYRSSNGTSSGSQQIQYDSDNTGSSSASYYRYWATASNFKPGSNSTSRYFRRNRNYKWIAVWL